MKQLLQWTAISLMSQSAISSFLENLGEGSNDLVIGSRYTGGIRIMNRQCKDFFFHTLLLSMHALLLVFHSLIQLVDLTVIQESALTQLKLDKIFSVGYAFQIELKYKVWSLGLPCKELPITFFERTDGKSKMSRKIIFEAVINVFRFRIKKILGTLN